MRGRTTCGTTARGMRRSSPTRPFGAYRAFGQQKATFVDGRMLDIAAARLPGSGRDCADGTSYGPRRCTYGARAAGSSTAAAMPMGSRARWSARTTRAAGVANARRERGRLIGLGLGCYVEFTGMGPEDNARWATARRLQRTAVIRAIPRSRDGHERDHRDRTGHPLRPGGRSPRTCSASRTRTFAGPRPHGAHAYSAYGTAGSRGRSSPARSVLEARATREGEGHENREPPARSFRGRHRDRRRPVPGRGAPARDCRCRHTREGQRGQRLPEGTEPGLEARYVHEPKNWAFSSGVHWPPSRSIGDGRRARRRLLDRTTIAARLNPMLVDGQLPAARAGCRRGADGRPRVRRERPALDPTFMATRADRDDDGRPALEHLETRSRHTAGRREGMSEGGNDPPPAAIATPSPSTSWRRVDRAPSIATR